MAEEGRRSEKASSTKEGRKEGEGRWRIFASESRSRVYALLLLVSSGMDSREKLQREGDGWEGKEEKTHRNRAEARLPPCSSLLQPSLNGRMNDPTATPWSPYPPSQPSPSHLTHLDVGPLPPRTSPPPAPPPISPEDVPRPRGSSMSSPRRPGLPNRNTSSSYKSDIQDNFRHSISISIPAPVGSMSISPANRE